MGKGNGKVAMAAQTNSGVLVELSVVVSVDEFNKCDGMVNAKLPEGYVFPLNPQADARHVINKPVSLIAVTSVVGENSETVLLNVNGCDLDMSLDPVQAFYPHPETRTEERTYHHIPGARLSHTIKDGDRYTTTVHTNPTHEYLVAFDPKPFIAVANLDQVRITNLPPQTMVRVTGYNVLRECFGMLAFVY